jgi:alkyl hydroperoxide reductase subunit AhpC
MTLHIGDVAPDFEAETTEGRIRFHQWLGDSWAVLFSDPKDHKRWANDIKETQGHPRRTIR